MKKHPDVDLKLRSKKVLELCIVISLAFHILVFFIFPKFDFEASEIEEPNIQLIAEEIPPTEHIKRPPPPSRPSVPIESEDEDIMDDFTIDETIVDFSDVPPPPPPPPEEEEEIPPFLPLEDQPKIIGGLASIKKYLKYPEIARKAGIEGLVIVVALIDKKGLVEDIRIQKSLGNNGCDEAAAEAIKKLQFIPAKQRGKPVKFWFSIPVRFTLTGNN